MKKIIFKSLLCFVFALMGIHSNAQVYTVNASSPTACDGAAYFIDSLNYGFTTFEWTDSNSTLSSGSSSITNLCPGTYVIHCSGSSSSGDTTFTFTILSGGSDPCAGFSASMAVQYATWGSCDASMTVTVQGGTAPYSYVWSNNNSTGNSASNLCYNSYHSVTVTDANGCSTFASGNATDSLNNPCLGMFVNVSVNNISSANTCDGAAIASASGGSAPYTYLWSNGSSSAGVSNLCAGTYTVNVTDSLGCEYSAYAALYFNSNDSSIVVNTTSSSVSDDGACDGNLIVEVLGGAGPYTFSLSNGTINSTGYFDSLCQGIYSVLVYDNNGDTISIVAIVSNPGNNFNNSSFSDSIYVDSVMSDLQENCQLNYQGIDSVYIAGYNFVGDSIMVFWNVVSNTGAITVLTQIYYIGNVSGVYSLGLQVYCPMKTVGNYFTARDQIFYPGLLGMQEQSLMEVNVYPNPATDQLNIQFSVIGDYEIALYDLSGRAILTQTHSDSDFVTINVNDLAKGQYTLLIKGEQATMSRSIVK